MRAFVTVLVALAASLSTAAQAATTPSLSIKVSGINVLYGHEVTLSGRLTSGLAGRPVSVYSRRFGHATMGMIATVRTGLNGGWSLRVAPQLDTRYEARAGAVVTPTLLVSVKPAIVRRVLGDGAIWAHVAAGRTLAGRMLELQRPRAGGWTTLERAVLDKRSDALFRLPIARGSLRARIALSVNAAGPGLLGAASDPFVVHARPAFVSLSALTSHVTFGAKLKLLGRISNGRAGETVTILAHKYGASARMRVAGVTSGPDGRWAAFVAPAIETTYQAHWNGIASRALVVGVRPAITVRRVAGSRIEATVAPLGVFVGRNVELQARRAGTWRTIAQVALAGPNGHGVFPPVASDNLKLRVAMSVNEAGAGYLEAASSALALPTRFVSLGSAASKVLYGHSLMLTGRISSARPGVAVTILARPYGVPAPTEAVTVLTGADGRWSFRTAPLIETSYIAHWGTAQSRPIVVGVQPRITVELLRSGAVATRVIANRPLRGRLVQLQELTSGNRWSTIMRMALDRRSSAIFAAVSTAAVAPTLRIALSVNQAGAGLLGASSHAFVYRNPQEV